MPAKDPRTLNGNTALVYEVCQATGLPRTRVTEDFRMFSKAMAIRLAAGKPFSIFGVGRFFFKVRKGRTIVWRKSPIKRSGLTVNGRVIVQKPSLVLKFKMHDSLKKKLREVPIPQTKE